MMSQVYPELRLDDTQVAEFSRRIYESVRQEVAAYSGIDDPATDRDFREMNRQNVLTFFRCLADDRLPRQGELAVLEQSARRRLRQAIPLEAVFHSYRVGVRVLWECVLEVAPQRAHGRLAVRALEYADRVSTAAAQAYLEERQQLIQSRYEASRLLLTRLLREEVEETAALAEAATLGLDFLRPHVLLVAGGEAGRSAASTDLTLAAAQRQLQTRLPDALAVLLSTGLVAVVPAPEVEAAIELTQAALPETGGARPVLTIGIGTPTIGVAGLAVSYHEALRAQALGPILHPNRSLHRYAELTLFDLFKEGPAMAAFVREVLGPLLDLDAPRRRRATETLVALFSGALNRKRAAFELGVHQNTLSHRLRRIEQLLGGSFLSGEFCFRVELALRLLPLASVRGAERSAELVPSTGLEPVLRP